MQFSFLLFVFLFSNFLSTFAKKNILFFAPPYGGSHVILHAKIADAIQNAEYNLLSFEPQIYEHLNPVDFEGPKLAKRFIVNGLLKKEKENDENGNEDYRNLFTEMFETDGLLVTREFTRSWQRHKLAFCEQLILRNDVLDKLRAHHFDAIIYEPFFHCAPGLAHLLGIKTQILLISMGLFEYAADLMGAPIPSSHVPALMMPVDSSDQMGYFERIRNFMAVEMSRNSIGEFGPKYMEMFRSHFGLSFPDIVQLAKEAALCFVNADEFLDFPRPLLPNIVPLGPLGLSAPVNASLDSPFKEEMEKGQNGIILVSLGTHMSTEGMPRTFLGNLLRAFGQHPNWHFLMKVDKQQLANMSSLADKMKAKNIFFTGWLPQEKLLANPRTRLFISHAGYNSMAESAQNGVPMLSIPFFYDQLRNANLPLRNGWGLKVARQTIAKSHSKLAEAISEVLTNPAYKMKAERTKRLLRAKPQKAEERLKAYLDLVLLEGEGKMPEWKSESRKMEWWTFHNLDIFLPAFILFQIGLLILSKLIWAISRKFIKIE